MTKMGLTKKLLKLMHIPQEIEHREQWFRTRKTWDKAKDKPREKKVAKYLKSRNPKLTEDEMWNLYLINKNTPLVCSHMDTVGDYDAQKQVHKIRLFHTWERINRLNAQWAEIVNNLWPVIVWQANIWADDKCGIAIAMELYEQLGDKISLLFTVWEETGSYWVHHFVNNNTELLKDITYWVVADRRWNKDLICERNDYGTEDFQDKILSYIWQFWYKPETGTFSDCDTLNEYFNCFNISCGYYEAHTDQEFVNVNEFENTYKALLHLIQNYNESMPKPTQIRGRNSYYGQSMGSEERYYNTYGHEIYNWEAIEIDEDVMYVNEEVELYWAGGQIFKLPVWDYYISTNRWGNTQNVIWSDDVDIEDDIWDNDDKPRGKTRYEIEVEEDREAFKQRNKEQDEMTDNEKLEAMNEDERIMCLQKEDVRTISV